MDTQSFANHRHNPKLSAIGFLFLLISVVGFALRWFHIGGRYSMAVGLIGLIAAVQVLLSISRLYTTKLQDRIIKLEMRVRAMSVLQPQHQVALLRLNKSQIIALRFASDAELPELIDRAGRENLSADDIKKAIKMWVADWDRT
ncbi:MAG TPA: DUF6526 family protein [Vicinamibacterales bacterium]|nr:DUF6526 family protein [Vicinamibacterales bacterium]